MRQNQWIDAKVYALLTRKELPKGCDTFTLVAVYASLLHNRNNSHCYVPFKNKSNNKTTSGYRLLARENKISLNTLKKYVPLLMEESICYFTKGGGFFMVGAKTLAEQYNNKKNKKVCIHIYDSLVDIKTSVMAVPIMTNIIVSQTKSIDKKLTLSKTKMALKKNYNVSLKQFKKLEKAIEAGYDFSSVQNNTILSVNGLERILESVGNGSYDGKYWKKKLVENGYLTFRRRFKSLSSKTMSYQEYLKHKPYFEGHITYTNGRICKEVVSEVSPTVNYNGIDYNPYNSKYMNSILNKSKNRGGEVVTSCQ